MPTIANNWNLNPNQANEESTTNKNLQIPYCPPQSKPNQKPNAIVNPRKKPQKARVNMIYVDVEQPKEAPRFHAAIEHQGLKQQYAILQNPLEYIKV